MAMASGRSVYDVCCSTNTVEWLPCQCFFFQIFKDGDRRKRNPASGRSLGYCCYFEKHHRPIISMGFLSRALELLLERVSIVCHRLARVYYLGLAVEI